MPNIPVLFEELPGRYKVGVLKTPKSFYFSIGEYKYTVLLGLTEAKVISGKAIDNADVVLKTTPELFESMVVKGKMPGALDITFGRIKTNDPAGLAQLRELFDFGS